ncbi:conserved hypothethical protein [Ralstonia solanacearum PSI07]|uniref:Uncharacterized protein n=1 Tax=blood disease bacterium R229 TaxID=741978 RepID=G2ZR01_9RALS|nr:conserved hypothethical protein [Ralstonia solanacearum PSI07]CCA81464.1 conserved hypothetical protein [blood disease bacterium R229]
MRACVAYSPPFGGAVQNAFPAHALRGYGGQSLTWFLDKSRYLLHLIEKSAAPPWCGRAKSLF